MATVAGTGSLAAKTIMYGEEHPSIEYGSPDPPSSVAVETCYRRLGSMAERDANQGPELRLRTTDFRAAAGPSLGSGPSACG